MLYEVITNRRNTVLQQMRDMSIISDALYQQAASEALYTNGQKFSQSKAPYFIEYIKKTLEDEVGSTRITSYNVCYTKLLRQAGYSLSIRGPHQYRKVFLSSKVHFCHRYSL